MDSPRFVSVLVGLTAALLGIAVMVGLVGSKPTEYQGKAIVFISRAFPSGQSAFELQPSVATFQTALELSESLEATSRAAGVPVDELRKGLSSASDGEGTIVEVTFGPSDRIAATEVPKAGAVAALTILAEQDLAQAGAKVEQSAATVREAAAAISVFEERTGFANLDADHDAQRRLLAALRVNTAVPAEELQAARARLGELAALRTERDGLVEGLARAKERLADAESASRVAEAKLAIVDAPGVVVAGEATKVSRVPAIARGAIGSVVVAIGGGLALFSLIERRQRRRSFDGSAAPMAAVDDAATQPCAPQGSAGAPATLDGLVADAGEAAPPSKTDATSHVDTVVSSGAAGANGSGGSDGPREKVPDRSAALSVTSDAGTRKIVNDGDGDGGGDGESDRDSDGGVEAAERRAIDLLSHLEVSDGASLSDCASALGWSRHEVRSTIAYAREHVCPKLGLAIPHPVPTDGFRYRVTGEWLSADAAKLTHPELSVRLATVASGPENRPEADRSLAEPS